MSDVLVQQLVEAALVRGARTPHGDAVEITLESTVATAIIRRALSTLVSHSAMTVCTMERSGLATSSEITEETQMDAPLAQRSEIQQVADFYLSELSKASVRGLDSVRVSHLHDEIRVSAIFTELPLEFRKAVFRAHSNAVLHHRHLHLSFDVVELCCEDPGDLFDLTPSSVTVKA